MGVCQGMTLRLPIFLASTKSGGDQKITEIHVRFPNWLSRRKDSSDAQQPSEPCGQVLQTVTYPNRPLYLLGTRNGRSTYTNAVAISKVVSRITQNTINATPAFIFDRLMITASGTSDMDEIPSLVSSATNGR